VAQYKDSTTYFVHKDHLGSTRVVTKMDKSVQDSMDYLPYGEQIAGDTTTNHKFTGKERDIESGLDNFGARYYGSTMGRFTSVDPINITRGRLLDPQRLTLYSYVRNNPLAYTDPDGRDLQLGTGPDQKTLVRALVDLARKPGGLALLKKLDDSKAVFKLNTVGKGELGGTGNYAVLDAKGTSAPKGTNDVSGTANITFDFQQRKEDKGMADAGLLDKSKVPASDSVVVGHELTHGEEFLKDPRGYSKTPENQREAQADANAAAITSQKNQLSEKEAKAEVEKILKPKEEKR